MIYSGVVWFNGYIFRCDDPKYFYAIELMANIAVPEMIKAEPDIIKCMNDLVVYGHGTLRVGIE